MSERRYSEREVREVFERAAREQEHATRRDEPEGLTVSEMQDIAASAGIAPEFVERAARSVALGEPEEGRLSMGPVPRGVFRTEFLPGPPTDALWAELVADLRRTFDARGRVTDTGRFHEWRNGNLCVTLEPAGGGSRLHLRTRRDNVTAQIASLAFLLATGLILTVTTILQSGFDPSEIAVGIGFLLFSVLGAGGVWAGQRSWADTRERQMREVAERAAVYSVETRVAAPGQAPSGPVPSGPGRIDPALLGLDVNDIDGGPGAERAAQSRGRA